LLVGQTPRKYAIKARKQYEDDKQKFIKTVLDDSIKYSQNSHIVEKATRAIVSITKSRGGITWISGKTILTTAGIIGGYYQNQSYGLWPWLDTTGAGVIKEKGKFPNTKYMIKEEFYDTMVKVV